MLFCPPVRRLRRLPNRVPVLIKHYRIGSLGRCVNIDEDAQKNTNTMPRTTVSRATRFCLSCCRSLQLFFLCDLRILFSHELHWSAPKPINSFLTSAGLSRLSVTEQSPLE